MANALDLFKLDGKVAVVTGGAKGIGAHYSAALAEAGSSVVIADIDASAVRDTVARLVEEHPGRILGVDLDVTQRASVQQLVGQVEATWGHLDILVNNAALFADLPSRSSPWGIPDEEWDQVMAVNIRGIYTCAETCAPLMQGEGGGKIINIASGLAFKGSTQLIHYAATKGAVVNLTRSMATALGASGIKVNAIAPGATASETLVAARGGANMSFSGARIIQRSEVPDDLIGTLLYLASPASDFVTGQTIVVDGGTYLH
jgi:NAD(P)-dependent dehydrogenase (short-subunit alcohol dehydrogenase family)